VQLLVLGGTHFVGRAVVETALARGDNVTTVNRGVGGPDATGVEALRADRTNQAELEACLRDRSCTVALFCCGFVKAGLHVPASVQVRNSYILIARNEGYRDHSGCRIGNAHGVSRCVRPQTCGK